MSFEFRKHRNGSRETRADANRATGRVSMAPATRAIRAAATARLAPRSDRDPIAFSTLAAELATELPRAVHAALAGFKLWGGDEGTLLLTEAPLDNPLPRTPTSRGTEIELPVAEMALATVGMALGVVLGFRGEAQGRVIQRLYPVPEERDAQTSASSGVRLQFHSETAFDPNRPDVLVLLCLRADPGGAAVTTFACAGKVLAHLSDSQIGILRQPRFKTGVDASFGGSTNSDHDPTVSPIYGSDTDPGILIDTDLMRAADPNDELAIKALMALNRAVENASLGVVMRPGDMLLIDNRRACHGRSDFRANYDGRDRLLLRAMVAYDPWRRSGERRQRSLVQERVGR
ncbi:L-asparagine oxygenase [Tahibacter aquaticus]|uniref:L-asparagine oxygenase n=1 Tax=Tahibacter aquaticus TaxID=520092 RepID=A0A4V3DN25_9GAMM|nr:TauD/TfdA family dioxygenase [Tahibacter aquaticus]TDR46796.1 L-asparagine oxygenase [Tahibacter aquaticus]